MFKESRTFVHEKTILQVDTGYQGLAKRHSNTDIPKKNVPRKKPLTKEDKKENQRISSSRFLVENVIRSLKIFRILAEQYRNRGKRFGLRLNLIAAIYNFQL